MVEAEDASLTRALNGESPANEASASSDNDAPPLIVEADKLQSSNGTQHALENIPNELPSGPLHETAEERITPQTYEDYSWRRLPPEVQEAAIRLGYTKEMWNEDQEPESSSKYWEELDPEEQEAAKVLGYDETTWNSEDDEMTPKDYDPMSWEDLPKHIQKAYGILGYDENLWDHDKSHAALEDKYWHQLTEEEQKAATIIGYTAETWNDEDNDTDAVAPREEPASLVEVPVGPKKFDGCTWEELASEVREAAKILEYTEESWNENKEPSLFNKSWGVLSVAQKESAAVLGYTETLWNVGEKEMTPKDYDEMFWNQLPSKIKKAYELMGYNEDLWDRDESPAAVDKDWGDLTRKEQRGARTVGYTEETWDEDSDDEDDNLESKSEVTGFKGQVIEFLTGSSYVLLDCMSMAAFFSVIESIFLIGKLFLNDNAVNVMKIVIGLAIMQYNGQLRKWLGADKATKKARSRRRREELTLFRSFLNVFSWWTTYAGVNHFFYAFEKDILSKTAEEWFEDFYETAKEAFDEELKLGSATGNMTCAYLENFDFNQTISGYLIGKACAWSESEWESMGHFYYLLAFAASALAMWLLFGDNFLKGCDV